MSHDLTSGGESSPDPATDKDSWELNQLPRESKMPAAGYDENHRYDHPSESTPFISAASSTRSASGGDALGADDPRDKYKWSVIVLSFSIAFVLELGMGVSMPAWNALLEKGLCGETYPDIAGTLVIGDDNPLCKNATVQGKLAMYRGWTFTLEALPTILLAVPYGASSERWGRKPIMVMCTVGMFLTMLWYQVVFYFSLPMWTTLLDFVWMLIGGGVPVGVSMLYTMLADVVHVDEMASVLFRFNSVFLVGELVSNPLGGFFLDISPWLSLLVGNVCMLVALSGFFFLPETLAVRRWHDAKTGKSAPYSVATRDSDDNNNHDDHDGVQKSRLQLALNGFRAQLRQVWNFLITNKRVVVLILPFVCVSLGKYIQELLLQYATKRYDWSWSKASYFLTLKSASFIIMLTLILPAMSTFCRERLLMSPLSKDLWLSRWSGLLLLLADLVITFSYTPLLYAAGLVLLAGGCGLPPLLRSLLNALVEPHHVGLLNTVVSFLETMGVMVAAPVFSWTLRVGIELGGGWLGLPFAVGTAITCVSTAIICVYRIPGDLERDIVEEDHLA